MLFQGSAVRLTAEDIARVARQLNTGVAEVRAFMEVEASGSGFDLHNRPKMLFEPHVFYRQLESLAPEKLTAAVEAGLAYKSWGERGYPSDSYPRLEQAIEIDETAALLSASWGLGQILGINYKSVGYATVQDMVLAFMESEAAQAEAIAAFILDKGIADDLRAHRWDVVARVYNGSGYAKHGYHTRLAAAYQKWARRETEGNMDSNISYPTVRFGAKGYVVEHLQKTLKALNYSVGHVDGVFGSGTRGAVLAFQADNDLETDGVVGPSTWGLLEAAPKPKPVSPVRAKATVADLREQGSATIVNGDRAQIAGAAAGGLGALGMLMDALAGTKEATDALPAAVEALKPVMDLAADNWYVILAIAGVAAVGYVQKMKQARVQDHRTGANLGR